jgi:hypothetical protein
MGTCTKSEVVIAVILMLSLAVTSSIVQLANAIGVGGGVDDIRGSKAPHLGIMSMLHGGLINQEIGK